MLKYLQISASECYITTVIYDDAMRPKTGLTPLIYIDSIAAMSWGGSSWTKTVTTPVSGAAMCEVDATNMPGLYAYKWTTGIPAARAVAIARVAVSDASVSTYANQYSTILVGRDLGEKVNNLDAAISSVGTAVGNLNDISSADAQSAATAALAAYDPPTRAEATLDRGEILTAIDGVPTTSEFSSGLTTILAALPTRGSDSKVLISANPHVAGVTIPQVNSLGPSAVTSLQNAAAGALNAYDPPTRTEAAADKDAIIAEIAALNDLSGADAQSAAAAALAAYDPPTRAEATADKDEILTAVSDPPGGDEEATLDDVLEAVEAVRSDSSYIRDFIVGARVVYTLTAGIEAAPVSGATIRVTTDAAGEARVAADQTTDANGQTTWALASGEYYVWRTKAGTAFANPDRLRVEFKTLSYRTPS